MAKKNVEKEVEVQAAENQNDVKTLYVFTVRVLEDGNIQIDPGEGVTPPLIEAACRDVYTKLHDQRLVETALQRLASNMAGLFAR